MTDLSDSSTPIRAELIPENPFNTLSHVEKIKASEGKREFLTVQEVKTLIDTECSLPVVKQAYLFACCCGLRLSDVYTLRWKDITIDGVQWRASVVMRKTPHNPAGLSQSLRHASGMTFTPSGRV